MADLSVTPVGQNIKPIPGMSLGEMMNFARGAQQYQQEGIALTLEQQKEQERNRMTEFMKDPANFQTNGRIDINKLNAAVPNLAPLTGPDYITKFTTLGNAQTASNKSQAKFDARPAQHDWFKVCHSWPFGCARQKRIHRGNGFVKKGKSRQSRFGQADRRVQNNLERHSIRPAIAIYGHCWRQYAAKARNAAAVVCPRGWHNQHRRGRIPYCHHAIRRGRCAQRYRGPATVGCCSTAPRKPRSADRTEWTSTTTPSSTYSTPTVGLLANALARGCLPPPTYLAVKCSALFQRPLAPLFLVRGCRPQPPRLRLAPLHLVAQRPWRVCVLAKRPKP
jgi:hypothetical protein